MKASIVGFTGTRHGMSEHQKEQVAAVLDSLGAKELHHGDCLGADDEAARIAYDKGIRVVAHPPEIQRYRAYAPGHETHDAKPYLERNRDIVDISQVLIATPDRPEVLRSGTWATVRYARMCGRKLFVIYP